MSQGGLGREKKMQTEFTGFSSEGGPGVTDVLAEVPWKENQS